MSSENSRRDPDADCFAAFDSIAGHLINILGRGPFEERIHALRCLRYQHPAFRQAADAVHRLALEADLEEWPYAFYVLSHICTDQGRAEEIFRHRQAEIESMPQSGQSFVIKAIQRFKFAPAIPLLCELARLALSEPETNGIPYDALGALQAIGRRDEESTLQISTLLFHQDYTILVSAIDALGAIAPSLNTAGLDRRFADLADCCATLHPVVSFHSIAEAAFNIGKPGDVASRLLTRLLANPNIGQSRPTVESFLRRIGKSRS